MYQTVSEAHKHLVRNHPLAYCGLAVAFVGAVVLAATGHGTLALVLFVAVGLSGLTMFRYEA